MAQRDTIETTDDLLRQFGDRLRALESLAFLKGTVSAGALRVGGFTVEVTGGGDLQVRRLSDDATTLVMAG